MVADTFNDYFSSMNELQGNIYHNGHNFTKYLKNRNDYSFFINSTDQTEIFNIINNISINKGTGPRSILTDIVHLIKFNISEPLANIVNLYFEKGL